jgi:hypothetical protein
MPAYSGQCFVVEFLSFLGHPEAYNGNPIVRGFSASRMGCVLKLWPALAYGKLSSVTDDSLRQPERGEYRRDEKGDNYATEHRLLSLL